MLRLTKLEIRKFDGVEPTTLTFGPGFNVLLGKNATGKTTLLEIIAAILGDDLGRIAERSHEIALAYELTDGSEQMSVEFSANAPPPAFEWRAARRTRLADTFMDRDVQVDVRLGDGTLAYTTRGGALIDGRDAVDVKRTVARVSWCPLLLFSLERRVGPSTRWWESPNTEGRFDEALSAWTRWFSGTDIDPLLVSKDRDGPVTVTMPPVFADLAHVVEEQLRPATEAPPQITVDASLFPPVADVLPLFELKGAVLGFRVRAALPSDGGIDAQYSGAELTLKRRDGSIFQAEHLSFGQKRLLAFLLYEHSTHETPAVLDELVNGLHYEWVELCMDKLRDRQTFLTAQNPLILDLLGFESAEQVRETFIQCARADGRMAWSNFTEEQASEFFGAYEVGIQQVHEVLRSKGLW